MSGQHFLLARDDSDAGINAERVGIDLASRAGARHTVLTVIPSASIPVMAVTGSVDDSPPTGATGAVVTYGVASIEICRFAEQHDADMIVLGSKPRSGLTRLILGDTADAVARRSLVPTLHIPPEAARFATMLVALDGSDRGLSVLRTARQLANGLKMTLKVVTVEPELPGESVALARDTPTGRTARLAESIEATGPTEGFIVRQGDPVTEILAAVVESEADILVVGYRRGGPPAVLEAGSVARRLVHVSPCAVLTVPL